MSIQMNLSVPRILALVGGVITLAGFFAMPWVKALIFEMTAIEVAQQMARVSSFGTSRSADPGMTLWLIYITPVMGLLILFAAFDRRERSLLLAGIGAGITALLLIIDANQGPTIRLSQPGSGYGAATLGLTLAAIAGLGSAAGRRRVSSALDRST